MAGNEIKGYRIGEVKIYGIPGNPPDRCFDGRSCRSQGNVIQLFFLIQVLSFYAGKIVGAGTKWQTWSEGANTCNNWFRSTSYKIEGLLLQQARCLKHFE